MGLNLGLYRDDGLGLVYMGPRECEKKKKLIADIFRANELKIKIEVKSKKVEFEKATEKLFMEGGAEEEGHEYRN